MLRVLAGLIVVTSALLPTAGTAQQRSGGSGKTAPDSVPKAFMPPAGMCRVWINGVQPSKQPAITTCAVAARNVPPNATVIWGDTTANRSKGAPPPSRSQSGGRNTLPNPKVIPPKVIPPKVIPPPDTTSGLLTVGRPR